MNRRCGINELLRALVALLASVVGLVLLWHGHWPAALLSLAVGWVLNGFLATMAFPHPDEEP